MKYFMIVFVHLLNDVSGSPRVLLNTIKTMKDLGRHGKLFIGSDGAGLLSDCGIPTTRYWYKRTGFRALTLFTYLLSQICLFISLVRDRSIDRNAVVYVNTLLPFGAAIYGYLTGRKVVYHVHESSIQPSLLQTFLVYWVKKASSVNIYVSDTHMRSLPIDGIRATRVYNVLDRDFAENAAESEYHHRHNDVFNVLMVGSLRDYKGVPEFLGLAERCKSDAGIKFELLLNESMENINEYFSKRPLPQNLSVYPATKDTKPYFRRASLLLNLSRVDTCVETFGMTILEAMAFGIPVIVPPVGGPAELVTDGVEGYLIDSRNEKMLYDVVLTLARSEDRCLRLSQAGRVRAAAFSAAQYRAELDLLLPLEPEAPGLELSRKRESN